ncbi:MAG: hypothetical protein OXL34_01405 [Gemmatimonadota bacterium]|nr:hypothetical protein [Gemmatimonadota bacterium]
MSLFGSHASLTTCWCTDCRSPFEFLRWRDRPSGGDGGGGPPGGDPKRPPGTGDRNMDPARGVE